MNSGGLQRTRVRFDGFCISTLSPRFERSDEGAGRARHQIVACADFAEALNAVERSDVSETENTENRRCRRRRGGDTDGERLPTTGAAGELFASSDTTLRSGRAG